MAVAVPRRESQCVLVWMHPVRSVLVLDSLFASEMRKRSHKWAVSGKNIANLMIERGVAKQGIDENEANSSEYRYSKACGLRMKKRYPTDLPLARKSIG